MKKEVVAWWKTQTEDQRIELTKQHVHQFASHYYLTTEQIENIYSLENQKPASRKEAHNPDNYKY